MSRKLTIALLWACGVAHADPETPPPGEQPTDTPTPAPESPPPPPPPTAAPAPEPETSTTSTTSSAAPADVSDQGIGASLGVVTGGRSTPGGLRVAGHYFYQLTDADWFDGVAGFTFGGGDAACFRDRMDTFLCDHGLADGKAVEISANVRRFLGGKGEFWPYIRAGVGVALVRFSDDEVTGLAIPLHAGGGLRVSVSPEIAIHAQAELELGFGAFNRNLGIEPQLGALVTAGAEFRL